jgi:hypothetical protein
LLLKFIPELSSTLDFFNPGFTIVVNYGQPISATDNVQLGAYGLMLAAQTLFTSFNYTSGNQFS